MCFILLILFSFCLVCPRIRYPYLTDDVLSCFMSLRMGARVAGYRVFCENPLVYSRYARVEVINDVRFYVVSPQRVVGVTLGPFVLALSLFERDIVRGIMCASCDNNIGFLRRGEFYFMDSDVDEMWSDRVDRLVESDADSDSGNSTESDVQHALNEDVANESFDSGSFE